MRHWYAFVASAMCQIILWKFISNFLSYSRKAFDLLFCGHGVYLDVASDIR